MKYGAAVVVHRFAWRARQFEFDVFPEVVAKPVSERPRIFRRPAVAFRDERARHIQGGREVAHQRPEKCLAPHPCRTFDNVLEHALDMLYPRDIRIERNDAQRLAARMAYDRAQRTDPAIPAIPVQQPELLFELALL